VLGTLVGAKAGKGWKFGATGMELSDSSDGSSACTAKKTSYWVLGGESGGHKGFFCACAQATVQRTDHLRCKSSQETRCKKVWTGIGGGVCLWGGGGGPQ
jgi:hypothetical protein